MKKRPASGAMALTNSTSFTKGSYTKPSTLLDAISRVQAVPEGVVEISNNQITGRIGVANNSIIVGAVVDSTGESGNAAVCKLLLLPFANFNFRSAVPLDKRHLHQDLNLSFDEAKRFLAGPSSIGLARPADNSLTGLQAITPEDAKLFLSDRDDTEFAWESTKFRSTFPENFEFKKSQGEPVVPGAYEDDCNKLLETVERKKTEEIYIRNFEAQQAAKAELKELKPGKLPSRPKEKSAGNPLLALVAMTGLMLVLGCYTLAKSLQPQSATESAQQTKEPEPAAAPSLIPTEPTSVAGANQEQPKPDPSGQAPFLLPSSSAPPPEVAPSASSSSTAPETASQYDDSSSSGPIPMPRGINDNRNDTPAPGAGTTWVPQATDRARIAQNQGLPDWLDAVRKNPRDANARMELSDAMLKSGDPSGSIQQFYEYMRLKRVETSEIISYSDSLTIFGSKAMAKQFLTDVLRTDPGNTGIRDKLSRM